ncbi:MULTISPECIES: protein arginine kinase [unclassified Sedimentibacter]|uniref:protein arginine kinase n=1 Tax=unclassified Sedimentibacter TaxID=2649220 RepID=UPI0027E1A565|nr:protein arginine kinase [Sedimentibacter sp. MB35-C1]WMJ77268.1 protein arginine kinase [Sedimentibacter sp. MB35-C1]
MESKDIVITSRIRLARNLKDYRFPIKMSQEESSKVIQEVNKAVSGTDLNYNLIYLKDLSDMQRNALVENHLISPALANNKDRGALLLSSDKNVSVMLNEEDHVRIQTLEKGMSLKKCWDLSNKIDDVIEDSVEYAFDKELGYVTSCPTNIGTGMRASVMIHLPALSITNQIEKLLYGVSQLGVAVRGVYGEGTKSLGHLYQVSNQGTLGASEETLIDKINQIVKQIVEKEEKMREHLKKNNFEDIEDEFYRAYGLLSNARKMATEEAMRLLSLIKLGREMEMIDVADGKNLYDLMVRIQPNNLLTAEDNELLPNERDSKRAEIIRKELLS